MKKSLVITILLIAGVSTALAHSLYLSLNKSNVSSSSQYVSASCQDYQASVRVGGVVKITNGKACRLADGRWRIYPVGNQSMVASGSQGGAENYSSACQRNKLQSQRLQKKQLQQFLHDIHGWNNGKQKQLKRFKHPPIKPGQKYHKKPQKQQPLLVDLPQDSYQNWH